MVLAGGILTNMQERKTHLPFFSYHARLQVTCSNRVCHRHIDIKKKKKKRRRLIDRKTISAFLRLWFGQQNSIGISNFSRPLSTISQGWTFVATEKKEKKEGHDNFSKDISWIIDNA
jgi:hypothetical protein